MQRKSLPQSSLNSGGAVERLDTATMLRRGTSAFRHWVLSKPTAPTTLRPCELLYFAVLMQLCVKSGPLAPSSIPMCLAGSH